MVKSPRYYQLKNAIHVATKATRGKAKAALDILNEMRVREYSRFYRCGLLEFGLMYDPASLRILRRV